MLVGEGPEPSAPEVGSCYSVVVRADGTCFIKAVGHARAMIIIGLFANEVVAKAWMEFAQTTSQLGC